MIPKHHRITPAVRINEERIHFNSNSNNKIIDSNNNNGNNNKYRHKVRNNNSSKDDSPKARRARLVKSLILMRIVRFLITCLSTN